MQISSIISLFISLEIYCFRTQSTVNICIAGLNHRAGYATVCGYAGITREEGEVSEEGLFSGRAVDLVVEYKC